MQIKRQSLECELYPDLVCDHIEKEEFKNEQETNFKLRGTFKKIMQKSLE